MKILVGDQVYLSMVQPCHNQLGTKFSMLVYTVYSLIDLNFAFRPFENHYEVHRKYVLSSVGEEFLQAPFTVMSVDPHASIIDRILGVTQRVFKRCDQNRGKQLKPRIVAALEKCHVEGTIEDIKFIGFGCENDTCIFFKDCFLLPNATKDPHFCLSAFSCHAHKLESRNCWLSLMESQQILCATDHIALV